MSRHYLFNGTMRVEGNKTFCFPRGQSLSVLLSFAAQISNKLQRCVNIVCLMCSLIFSLLFKGFFRFLAARKLRRKPAGSPTETLVRRLVRIGFQ